MAVFIKLDNFIIFPSLKERLSWQSFERHCNPCRKNCEILAISVCYIVQALLIKGQVTIYYY
jgi:hypothetical protein